MSNPFNPFAGSAPAAPATPAVPVVPQQQPAQPTPAAASQPAPVQTFAAPAQPGGAFVAGQPQPGGVSGYNPFEGFNAVGVGGRAKDYLKGGLYVLRLEAAKLHTSKKDGKLSFVVNATVEHAVDSKTHVAGSSCSWVPKWDERGQGEVKALMGAAVFRLHPQRDVAEVMARVDSELLQQSIAARPDGRPAVQGFRVAVKSVDGVNPKTGTPYTEHTWRPIPQEIEQQALATGWTDDLVRQLALA